MDKNHLDNDFARIAELFQTYQKAISQNNNDSLLEQIKTKIVVQFWKTVQQAAISAEMKEQSDLIVTKIRYCLTKYTDKEATEFCRLTYASIMKSLKSKIDINTFETKSGMHITDSENRLRKRIEKAYKQFKTLNSGDKNEFIEYAVSFYEFDRKDVEEYLFPKQTISLFVKNIDDSGEEYCIADKYTNSDKGNDFTESLDSKNSFLDQLDKINKVWLEQKKGARAILSELLTRELLADFTKCNSSESFIDNLMKFDFICKDMIRSFFGDVNYKLPSRQDVGEKYGLTKSAVSVKLKRFIEKIIA